MASQYPLALDALPTNHSDNEVMAGIHAQVHNDLADAVNKVEAELGVDPSGSVGTVAARFAIPRVQAFSKSGVLAVAAGVGRFVVPFACTIQNVRAAVGTAPTGASVIVDVNKNGSTIFTTQGNRPTIPASANVSGKSVPDVLSLVDGDYLTVDIDQIGATIAGSDLTVLIAYTV